MILSTAENVEYYKEKLFSYGISGLMCLLLPAGYVGLLYIIMGLSHYSMTALYQYKAGRITPNKFAKSVLLAICLLTVSHIFPRCFTVFASGFLLVHVFSGEIRHFNRTFSLPYFIMTSCLIVFLCAWLSMQLWPGFVLNMPYVIAVLTMFVAFAAYRYFKDIDLKTMDAFFPTLLGIYTVFVIMEFCGVRPLAVQAFGFITIAHFLTTYYNVTKRFRTKDAVKAKIFVNESIAMNILMLAGFIVGLIIGQHSFIIQGVYESISFYAWTVVHFLTTWNNDDYGNIFKGPGRDGRVGMPARA